MAERACTMLSRAEGVVSVDANTLTGSLTIRYDPRRTSHSALLDRLSEQGYVRDDIDVDVGDPIVALSSRFAEKAVKTAATVVVEKVLERSAVKLIGALI